MPSTLLSFASIAVVLSLQLACSPPPENTYTEGNDASNSVVGDAEATGFVLQEFGTANHYKISGTFDVADDSDCFATSVKENEHPSLTAIVYASATAVRDQFPLDVHVLDADGQELSVMEKVGDEESFSAGGATWVFCVTADETFSSGDYSFLLDDA